MYNIYFLLHKIHYNNDKYYPMIFLWYYFPIFLTTIYSTFFIQKFMIALFFIMLYYSNKGVGNMKIRDLKNLVKHINMTGVVFPFISNLFVF